MNRKYNIRSAAVDHAEEIVTVMRENLDSRLLDSQMLIYACDGISAFVAEEIAIQDQGGDTHFTAAFADGELAACAEVKRFPQYLSLNYIAVRPAFRSRGLGTELLREATALAGTDGRCEMTLDVLADNAVARAWYERLGFRTKGTGAWWTLPLKTGDMSPVLLSGYPQSQVCQKAYGFSLFGIVSAGHEYKIGRLGKKWFRLSDSEALRAPGVLGALSRIDPSRQILLSASDTELPPVAEVRSAAQWCHMVVELDALHARLGKA